MKDTGKSRKKTVGILSTVCTFLIINFCFSILHNQTEASTIRLSVTSNERKKLVIIVT